MEVQPSYSTRIQNEGGTSSIEIIANEYVGQQLWLLMRNTFTSKTHILLDSNGHNAAACNFDFNEEADAVVDYVAKGALANSIRGVLIITPPPDT